VDEESEFVVGFNGRFELEPARQLLWNGVDTRAAGKSTQKAEVKALSRRPLDLEEELDSSMTPGSPQTRRRSTT